MSVGVHRPVGDYQIQDLQVWAAAEELDCIGISSVEASPGPCDFSQSVADGHQVSLWGLFACLNLEAIFIEDGSGLL